MKELSGQNGNENISYNKFNNFVNIHPTILFPIFDFQRILHKNILGASYWEQQGKKRILRDKGEYISIIHTVNLPQNYVKVKYERGQSFCDKKNHIKRKGKNNIKNSNNYKININS